MTKTQKIIKYIALAFAIILIAGIISGIVSLAGYLFFGFFDDAVLDETKTYYVSGEVSSIKIEINAAEFYIEEGDSFLVESNLKHLQVEENSGTLVIKETKKRSGRDYGDALLVFTVPKDFIFDVADITTGAGKVTIEKLSAKDLDLTLGAGQVTIEELNASLEAEITGGAGEVNINGGVLNNLEFEMGVGELNLRAKITGNGDIDLGVGEANLRFIGSADEYTLEVEKAIGSITLDGKNIQKSEVLGNGANRVDISGGIGDINITFTE